MKTDKSADKERRYFLKGMSGVLALSLADIRLLAANELQPQDGNLPPINMIIPKSYIPPSSATHKEFRNKLKKAILDFLEANYTGSNLPVWRRRFETIDLEKRVDNIIYWLLQAVQMHKSEYPVDPVWIMAQMMKESYFYEFAISNALAVGICQFVQRTAESYDMLCAGRRPEHHQAPYRKANLAGKLAESDEWRQKRREYRRNNRPAKRFGQTELMEIIERGESALHRDDVIKYLTYQRESEAMAEKRREARRAFREYLEANVEGRSIFDKKDLDFFLGFDERFTYKKPVRGMVEMMAWALKNRSGNILAASIAYNAGLSSTRVSDGVYRHYGKIPAIEESTQYISQVLVNHYEISKRL